LIDTEWGPVRASNAILIAFPECTGGQQTIRYASVGTAASGSGKIIYSGKLIQDMLVSTGIILEFKPGDVAFAEA
jgi:hypothetical protein